MIFFLLRSILDIKFINLIFLRFARSKGCSVAL